MKIKFATQILSVAGFLLAATFAPASSAQSTAQDQGTPPSASQPAQPESKHGDRFAGLSLTDDQKAQIKQIRQAAKAKADAILADGSLSDADQRAKVRAIRMAARKQTREVLTPDQRKQLKAKMRNRRAERAPSMSM